MLKERMVFLTTLNSIALFAPIEADLENINSTQLGYRRLYEAEAIKCFSCWRKNGGTLADIQIYAICPSRNKISIKTQEELKKLNVTYVEIFISETDNYECGFWNIPLVGSWAEENLNYDFLIKIDLDLYLINQLPMELIKHVEKVEDVVGVHDHLAHEYLSTLSHHRYKDFYNTGITITRRSRGFFKQQYSYLFKMLKEFNDSSELFCQKYQLLVSKEIGPRTGKDFFEYNLLEELCVSVMVEETGYRIHPLKNYCLETMDYELEGDVDFDKDKIFFIHEHIDGSERLHLQLNKIRYAKFFGNNHGYRYFFEYK